MDSRKTRAIPYSYYSLIHDRDTIKGRGIVRRTTTTDCVCYVPTGSIQCTACGAVMTGRVRVRCTQHPKTLFISDIERCFKCQAPSCYLKDIPVKKM